MERRLNSFSFANKNLKVWCAFLSNVLTKLFGFFYQETSWSSQPRPRNTPAIPYLWGKRSHRCQQDRRVPGGDAGSTQVGITNLNIKWEQTASWLLNISRSGIPGLQQRTVNPMLQEMTSLPGSQLTSKTQDRRKIAVSTPVMLNLTMVIKNM